MTSKAWWFGMFLAIAGAVLVDQSPLPDWIGAIISAGGALLAMWSALRDRGAI